MSDLPDSRRDRKRQQLIDRLADTAWTLFESQGYDAVTMEAIAATADVAKGTLYKHFPVKDAVLTYLFHRDLATGLPEILTALAELPQATARMRWFFRHSVAWTEHRRPYMPAYLRYRFTEIQQGLCTPEKRSGMSTLFLRMICYGQETGEFRTDLSAAMAGDYLSYLYLAALMRWLSGSDIDLTQELDAMLSLFIGGLEALP